MSKPQELSDDSVAGHLLKRKFYLAALEFHQELLEANNGIHNVTTLNQFFSNPQTYAALVNKVLGDEESSRKASFSGATASVVSPFSEDGLQPALAARDQKIALLEFRLRSAELELTSLRRALKDAPPTSSSSSTALATTTTNSGSASSATSAASTAVVARPTQGSAVDEDGLPITDAERRTLNALVTRYLGARGYKCAAAAFSAELTSLGGAHGWGGENHPHHHHFALQQQQQGGGGGGAGGGGKSGGGKGSATNSGGSTLNPNLSLLAMHRKRIAPMQAAAAEEATLKAKVEAQLASVREEARVLNEQLELTGEELAASRDKVARLEADLLASRTMKGSAATATATATAGASSTGPSAPPLTHAAPPPAPTSTLAVTATTSTSGSLKAVNVVHTPALLRSAVESFPVLLRSLISRQKAAALPLVGAAAATEATPAGRRRLVTLLLTAIRRPGAAERALIACTVGVLAGRLGGVVAEEEIMGEVCLLAKVGKTKERKALAGLVAGTLGAYVSEKRADTLIATLRDLGDSRFGVTRSGVVAGVGVLAKALMARGGRGGSGSSSGKGEAGGTPSNSPTVGGGGEQGGLGASSSSSNSATAASGSTSTSGGDAASSSGDGGVGARATSLRQYAALEEVMWRVLLGGGGHSNSSSSSAGLGVSEEDAEAEISEELAMAAAAEAATPLDIPGLYACAGSKWAGELEKQAAALVAAAASSSSSTSSYSRGGGSSSASAAAAAAAAAGRDLPLPSSWSIVPPTIADAVFSSLVPTMFTWAHSLGLLWSETLPNILAMLGKEVGCPPTPFGTTPPPSTGGGGGGGGKSASTPSMDASRARRVRLILGVLSAAAPVIKGALLADGYKLAPLALPPAVEAAQKEAAEAAARGGGLSASSSSSSEPPLTPSDFLYELFDYTSQSALRDFPSEIPLGAYMQGGVVVNTTPTPTSSSSSSTTPTPSPGERNALIAAALLRGTAAVRYRRNAPAASSSSTTTANPWKEIPDERVAVYWPALKFTVRNLLPGLLQQGGCVRRNTSEAGRGVVDAYGATLSTLGEALGAGSFMAYALRPMFLRGLCIPCSGGGGGGGGEGVGGGASAAAAAAAAAAATPSAGPSKVSLTGLPPPTPPPPTGTPGLEVGRKSSLVLLAQALFGPSAKGMDKAAAKASASGAAFQLAAYPPGTPNAAAAAGAASDPNSPLFAPLNWAAAGAGGGDWPYLLPELSWMGLHSPINPIYALPGGSVRVAFTAPPPPITQGLTPGVKVEWVTRLGGAYNAEALLPLLGAVLGCLGTTTTTAVGSGSAAAAAAGGGGLQGLVEGPIRSLVEWVGGGKNGWAYKTHQDALETFLIRACATAAAAAPVSASSSSSSPFSGPPSTPIITTVLTDVLSRTLGTSTGEKDKDTRLCVLGCMRALLPYCPVKLLGEVFLPTLKAALTASAPDAPTPGGGGGSGASAPPPSGHRDPEVHRAAVRSLGMLFTWGVCGEGGGGAVGAMAAGGAGGGGGSSRGGGAAVSASAAAYSGGMRGASGAARGGGLLSLLTPSKMNARTPIFLATREGEKLGREVQNELRGVLERGPKVAIQEALRALTQAVPSAPTSVRDDFALVCLLTLAGRVTGAAAAGHEAMTEFNASLTGAAATGPGVGGVGGEVREAAKGALYAHRAAAIQGAPPWPKAKAEDLGDVALSLEACFSAFRGVLWTAGGAVASGVAQASTCDVVKEAWWGLLDPTLLLFPEELLRIKREHFLSTFPPAHNPQAAPAAHHAGEGGRGGWGEEDTHHHHQQQQQHHNEGDYTGIDTSLAQDMAAARDAGITPDSLLQFSGGHHGPDGGGGGGESGGRKLTGMASKMLGQWGSALKHAGSSMLGGVGEGGGMGGMGGMGGGGGSFQSRSTPERGERRSSFTSSQSTGAGGAGAGAGGGVPSMQTLSLSAFTSSPNDGAPPGGVGAGSGSGRRGSVNSTDPHPPPPPTTTTNMSSFLGGGGGKPAAHPPLHPSASGVGAGHSTTAAGAGAAGAATPGKGTGTSSSTGGSTTPGFGLKGMMGSFGLGGGSKQ